MDLPIRMLLPCPGCGRIHVDHGEWATRHHSSHLCEYCGLIWKPCMLPTVGVLVLCNHTWVERRWYVGGDQGSVVVQMCLDCGERKREETAEEKPDLIIGGLKPPPGCVFLGAATAADDITSSSGPVTDEARGDGLAINSTMAPDTVRVKLADGTVLDVDRSAWVHRVPDPSYHPTPGMGLTEAGCRRLREVADYVEAELGLPPGSVPLENPTGNPGENPEGTPGMALAPPSGPR